jgi:flagellar biosynthesis regulator FlbT
MFKAYKKIGLLFLLVAAYHLSAEGGLEYTPVITTQEEAIRKEAIEKLLTQLVELLNCTENKGLISNFQAIVADFNKGSQSYTAYIRGTELQIVLEENPTSKSLVVNIGTKPMLQFRSYSLNFFTRKEDNLSNDFNLEYSLGSVWKDPVKIDPDSFSSVIKTAKEVYEITNKRKADAKEEVDQFFNKLGQLINSMQDKEMVDKCQTMVNNFKQDWDLQKGSIDIEGRELKLNIALGGSLEIKAPIDGEGSLALYTYPLALQLDYSEGTPKLEYREHNNRLTGEINQALLSEVIAAANVIIALAPK